MKYSLHRIKTPIYLLITCIGLLFVACDEKTSKAGEDIIFNIPDGFEIEELYAPGASDQGSWVSLTEGPGHQFYACDQYGDIYTFVMPAKGKKLNPKTVTSVDLNIGFAQGLLWAFNSLYVVVVKNPNEEKPDDPSTGVYRLKDTDGDGILDDRTKLLTLDGEGEHGPHTLRVSPDSASLYFIAGNFNTIPENFKSRLPKNWGEDNLFPPYLDARGHAVDLKAPGGWLAKTDPEGKEWEIIGAGMRNPFSFGINEHGELFAYDADMEWDFGMPWYRPTRILHVTSGAEFGWRTGSGKWPVEYPDNLPAVENMSQGSPTAVIMGRELNFPSKFRNGLFACDWSFGTIYYVDLEEEGSSYKGSREEFLSGVPLPISNAIAGTDGNLYFLTGGRRLESHLYRVSYTGEENTEDFVLTDNPEARKLRALRKSLEYYHDKESPEAISASWTYLDHEDRFIRYAARIALEHQPQNQWIQNLWQEGNPEKILTGSLAYARSDGVLNHKILQKLEQVDWTDLTSLDKIALLRTYSLLLIRQGKPSKDISKRITSRLSPIFPSGSAEQNRLLSQILVYLDSPDAVAKCIAIMENETRSATASHPDILSKDQLERSKMYGPQIAEMVSNMPPTEGIHYVTVLSHATKGWTKELRTKYFEWFFNALGKKGGMSYKAFLDNIRAKALMNVPEKEKAHFQNISGFYSPTREMANLPQPIGPGKAYNMYDLNGIVPRNEEKLKEYDGRFVDGKRAYEAALCAACHRIKGEGGASGPDLTNLHTRFNNNDIINSLLSPNEEISDQYAFTVFTVKNNEKIAGRIVSESDTHYTIYQSPYDVTNTIQLDKSEILEKKISPLSPMPAKLLDRLNEQEVEDLFVYLLTGGDENHEYYKQDYQ